MRRPFGLGFKRVDDDLLDLTIFDLPWRSRSGLVVQALEPTFCEPSTPTPNCASINIEFLRNHTVMSALCYPQNDTSTPRQILGRLPSTNVRLERVSLIGGQDDPRCCVPIAHAVADHTGLTPSLLSPDFWSRALAAERAAGC